jgi:hypothetical protein
MHGLRDTQASGVAGSEDRSVFDVAERAEELEDFFRTQYNRQFLRFLGHRDNVFKSPVFVKGDLIQEAQGGDCDQGRARRELSFVDQVDLVSADILRP